MLSTSKWQGKYAWSRALTNSKTDCLLFCGGGNHIAGENLSDHQPLPIQRFKSITPAQPHGFSPAFAITPIFCAKAMKVGVLIARAAAL